MFSQALILSAAICTQSNVGDVTPCSEPLVYGGARGTVVVRTFRNHDLAATQSYVGKPIAYGLTQRKTILARYYLDLVVGTSNGHTITYRFPDSVTDRVRVLVDGASAGYLAANDPASIQSFTFLWAQPQVQLAIDNFKKIPNTGWFLDLSDAFRVGASDECNTATARLFAAVSTLTGAVLAEQYWAIPGLLLLVNEARTKQLEACGRP